jgi:hypothetical protein
VACFIEVWATRGKVKTIQSVKNIERQSQEGFIRGACKTKICNPRSKYVLFGGNLGVLYNLNSPYPREEGGLGVLEPAGLNHKLLKNGQIVENCLVQVVNILLNLEKHAHMLVNFFICSPPAKDD